MKCEHAVVTGAEDLARDEKGCVLCPLCAGRCWVCGRVFHVDDLDEAGACVECAAGEAEIGYEENKYEGVVEMSEKDLRGKTGGCGDVEDGVGLARRAAEKLVELSGAEGELEALRERQAGLQGEADEVSARIEGIRGELCSIVEGCGGALDVEGFSRPLVVRRRRSFSYSEDSLAGWLKKFAPDFLMKPEGFRIDRRGLRRAFVVKDNRVFLPGKKGPVRGVKVVESICIAIPGAGPDENEGRG